MILSILLELHIFNKDINIVNSAKRKKMVLKSFLTLNCNYSNKVKNCQGAGRFILKKRFTRSLTVNKHFFLAGGRGRVGLMKREWFSKQLFRSKLQI